MSHDDHGHAPGGHEVDKMPNARLFKLMVGLSALTLLSSIGVIQLFNLQVRGIEGERNAQPAHRLQEYRAEQAELRGNHGRVLFLDDDGLTVELDKAGVAVVGSGTGITQGLLLRMPVDDAKALVLKDATKFKAVPKYPFWKDPSLSAEELAKAAAAKPKPRGANRKPAGKRPRGAGRPPAPRKPGARPAGKAPVVRKPPVPRKPTPAPTKPAGGQ